MGYQFRSLTDAMRRYQVTLSPKVAMRGMVMLELQMAMFIVGAGVGGSFAMQTHALQTMLHTAQRHEALFVESARPHTMVSPMRAQADANLKIEAGVPLAP